MPLAAAGVGFGVTVVLLGGLWALMCYTALLLLEVYQHVPADTGLGSLAARYLGRYGQWITGFSMMFLMYALTAAYISGAGELIASSINDGFGASLSPETGAIVFTLIGGGVVCAGTSLVDLFNRFLFSAKILFLIVMLVLLAPHVHKINLLSLPLEKGLALSAIPVIFTIGLIVFLIIRNHIHHGKAIGTCHKVQHAGLRRITAVAVDQAAHLFLIAL